MNPHFQSDNLAHAYLFTGSGAAPASRAAAQALLCVVRQACGTCRACRALAQNTHPDYRIVSPAEKETAIKVDAVRESFEFLAELPQMAARRVLHIQDAHTMTVQAQNALLKMLENPPADSVLLLSGEDSLLPTVRSRCVRIRRSPDRAEITAHLLARGADRADAELYAAAAQTLEEAEELAADARLRVLREQAHQAARAFYADPAAQYAYYAAHIKKKSDPQEEQLDLRRVLMWQASFFADAAALSCGGGIVNADAAALLPSCPDTVRSLALFDLLTEALARLAANANSRLTLGRMTVLAARLNGSCRARSCETGVNNDMI